MFGSHRESVSVYLPDGAGDEKFPIFVAPSDHSITIEKATFVIPGGSTAGTASLELSLENGGTGGTATTNMGGTAGGTAGWSDNVPQTVTPTAGSGQLAAGEVLVVDWNEVDGGPSGALGVLVTVEYVHGLGEARN
jgi:hypothetical protein